MRLAEPLADFQFLANGDGAFLTHNLEFDNASGGSTLKRTKVENASEINA